MRRFGSLVWMLGSVMAVSAALVVTFAHAAPRSSGSDADAWSKDEMAVLASLSLKRLPPLPVDPSNAVERLPAAVDLGRRLFSDARFSRNGAVSCASCHDPQKQFQDGLPVGRGVGTGSRRSMPIVGAGYSTRLFWDGRKDSLWAQALGPLEDEVEHGGNRTRHAQLLASNYRKEYEALFNAMPQLEGLPQDAGPNGGTAEKAAWAAMDARQREDVSRVFANMGKAIAAYEKSLQHEPSRLDRYIDAVVSGWPAAQESLRADEVRGLRLFIGKAQCVTCHNGPLFTDQQFHNTGMPPCDVARPDRGRADATAKVRGDEFNCLGPFSDAQPKLCQELRFMVSDESALQGAFKTPGLRGIAQRAPYMHAGQLATLEQVVRHYVAAPHAAVGHSELTHRHGGGVGAVKRRSYVDPAEAAWQAPGLRVYVQGSTRRAAQHGRLVQSAKAGRHRELSLARPAPHLGAAGTFRALYVLQELGGWASYAMVQRYAHLAANHLAPWAERLARPRRHVQIEAQIRHNQRIVPTTR